MKSNTEIEIERNADVYSNEALALMIGWCRLFVEFLGFEKGGELFSCAVAFLDRSIHVNVGERAIFPVLSFRVPRPGADDVLVVPKDFSAFGNFAYPLVHMMKKRPELFADPITVENLSEIDRLLYKTD